MSGKFNLIERIYEESKSRAEHVAEKYPERSWAFDVQKVFWSEIYNAKEMGKPLIFMSGCAPVELMYAFDCVPILMDSISSWIATQPDLSAKYVDEAQKYVPDTMCGIDKVPISAMLLGDLPAEQFDAGMYTTVPCDSSRASYPAIADMVDGPSICFDIPFQKDDMGYNYMASQFQDAITFLEDLTGKKMDWDKFEEVAELSNNINIYMKKIADLRKNTPCPLPGSMLFLNQMIPVMVGNKAMLESLELQYETANYLVEMGIGAVPEEKHRILWLQNMLWSDLGILNWLEREHNAIVVMEAFGYQEGHLFEDATDPDQVLYDLAVKSLAIPMIHGSSGPVEDYLNLVDGITESYDINLSMNVGHVGCKHSWAVAKIVTDFVQEKYGITTLSLDVDAVDSRYKKSDEIKEKINEYMDTVANIS